MKTSLIIPLDDRAPSDIIKKVVTTQRQANPESEIILSCYGQIDKNLADRVINTPRKSKFSLSVTRNLGALASTGDWVAFIDFDCLCQQSVVLDNSVDIIRGVTRRDIYEQVGEYYKCTNSPIYIKRESFFKIGGYCTKFTGWGYEDSDFEHKALFAGFRILDWDSKTDHFLDLHNILSNGNWGRGSEQNAQLFRSRHQHDSIRENEEQIKVDQLSLHILKEQLRGI